MKQVTSTLISPICLIIVLLFAACKRNESIDVNTEQLNSPATKKVDGVKPSKTEEVEIVDFEGFINYGTPIEVQPEDLGTPIEIVVTESRIEMPVFTPEQLETYRKKNTQKAEQGGAHQSTTRSESESE